MFAGEAIADILSRPEEISMDFAVIVGVAARRAIEIGGTPIRKHVGERSVPLPILM